MGFEKLDIPEGYNLRPHKENVLAQLHLDLLGLRGNEFQRLGDGLHNITPTNFRKHRALNQEYYLEVQGESAIYFTVPLYEGVRNINWKDPRRPPHKNIIRHLSPESPLELIAAPSLNEPKVAVFTVITTTQFRLRIQEIINRK